MWARLPDGQRPRPRVGVRPDAWPSSRQRASRSHRPVQGNPAGLDAVQPSKGAAYREPAGGAAGAIVERLRDRGIPSPGATSAIHHYCVRFVVGAARPTFVRIEVDPGRTPAGEVAIRILFGRTPAPAAPVCAGAAMGADMLIEAERNPGSSGDRDPSHPMAALDALGPENGWTRSKSRHERRGCSTIRSDRVLG